MRTETSTRDSGTTHALAKSKVCVQLCEHDTSCEDLLSLQADVSCSNFEASSSAMVVVSVF